jgi:hypothetical protein
VGTRLWRAGSKSGFERCQRRGAIAGFRGRFPLPNLIDRSVCPGGFGARGLEDESRCEDVDVRSVGEWLVSVEVGPEDRCDCFPASGRVAAEAMEMFE